jgi:hypothetical protein
MRHLTPLRAIRAKCLDCSAFQPKEVRLCPDLDCPLYPYRFGTNPKRKGIGNLKGSFKQKSQTQLRNSELKEEAIAGS